MNDIQQIHPSSQNLMTMSLHMLLCLSHRKWTLRAFRRRGKRRYSSKHYHCPLNMCVQIGIKQLNRSTNVKPRCRRLIANSETANKCETQMYRNWMNSLGVSPRVNYLYSGMEYVFTTKSLSLSFHFLPRDLILISHNLWVDQFFFWRRELIDVILGTLS